MVATEGTATNCAKSNGGLLRSRKLYRSSVNSAAVRFSSIAQSSARYYWTSERGFPGLPNSLSNWRYTPTIRVTLRASLPRPFTREPPTGKSIRRPALCAFGVSAIEGTPGRMSWTPSAQDSARATRSSLTPTSFCDVKRPLKYVLPSMPTGIRLRRGSLVFRGGISTAA
jgi:hypothetical protein